MNILPQNNIFIKFHYLTPSTSNFLKNILQHSLGIVYPSFFWDLCFCISILFFPCHDEIQICAESDILKHSILWCSTGFSTHLASLVCSFSNCMNVPLSIVHLHCYITAILFHYFCHDNSHIKHCHMHTNTFQHTNTNTPSSFSLSW